MFDSVRFTPVKFNIFSTTLIAFIIIFADSKISTTVSLHSQDDHHHPHRYLVPLLDANATLINGGLIKDYRIKDSGLDFEERIGEFIANNQCKVQFFMTWISPAASFTEREFFGLESLFQMNPESCLVILSRSMDSLKGKQILDPLIDRGFRVRAITPDLSSLFKNTPAANWLSDIEKGIKNPGEIPLAQNLSNLIRLAVLYNYGGVYLDADFIVLKDFSNLRTQLEHRALT